MLVVIRGAEILLRIALRLYRAGARIVMMMEVPTAVRHPLHFPGHSPGRSSGRGHKAVRAKDVTDVLRIVGEKNIAVLVDPKAYFRAQAGWLVDAILAKRNIGTTRIWLPS